MIKKFESFIDKEKQELIKEIKESLLRDCKPILSDLKKVQKETVEFKFLWRGLGKKGIFADGVDFEKFVPLKNRKPIDTSIALHKYINDYFEEKFGVRIREECVFADTFRNSIYGEPHMMFPIGEYTVYYSDKISDFYRDSNNSIEITYFNFYMKNVDEYSEESLDRFVNKWEKIGEIDAKKELIWDEKDWFDENFLETYKKYDGVNYDIMRVNNEVMIMCDKYYLVGWEYMSIIKKLISEL